jgi:glycine cleavage system H protein
VNREPYGAGWMLRLKPADPAAVGALLDASAYGALLG